MKTAKLPRTTEKRGSAKRRAFTQTDLNEAVAAMDRAAIAKLIKAANKTDTDLEKQAMLFELAVSDPNLNDGAAFTTVFCMITMAMQFRKMSGTQRQALALDPRVVRAIFPHVALAFPKQTDEMFKLWFMGIANDHPKLWKSIYDRAGDIGPQSKAQKARAGK